MAISMIGDKSIKKKGFTLAELLVVTFLFGLAVAILAQTYVSFIRLSHRTSNSAALQQDMRFVMEYLSRNIRTVPIDYPTSGSMDAVTSTLRLKAEGQPGWLMTRAGPDSPYCGTNSGIYCILVSADGGMTWSPVTSRHVNVEKFDVFVRPLESPFVLQGNAYANNHQPFTTIHIKLSFDTPNAKEKVYLEAQTTISSRVYVR